MDRLRPLSLLLPGHKQDTNVAGWLWDSGLGVGDPEPRLEEKKKILNT